jgi:hypothetical protein
MALPAFSQEGDSLRLERPNDSLVPLVHKPKIFFQNPDYKIIEDYSTPMGTIDLEEIVILGELRFDNPAERRRYLILQRKTRKVWPYAMLTAERLTELNRRLATLEDKSDRKDYVEMIQEYIEDEFKEELKKLTKTEGQILVKLIYRQTGTTAYDMVKELKSGWRAFWYNTTASFFNISLKEEYRPESIEEDFLIEDILQRSFRKGILERQDPAIPIDYLYLLNKWNG